MPSSRNTRETPHSHDDLIRRAAFVEGASRRISERDVPTTPRPLRDGKLVTSSNRPLGTVSPCVLGTATSLRVLAITSWLLAAMF